MRKQIIISILIILLSACGGTSTKENSEKKQGVEPVENPTTENVTISLIHLNDLHANLTSHNEAFRSNGGANINIANAGGIIKIASKVKELR